MSRPFRLLKAVGTRYKMERKTALFTLTALPETAIFTVYNKTRVLLHMTPNLEALPQLSIFELETFGV